MIWTEDKIKLFKELYPYNYGKDVADILGVHIDSIYRLAIKLKLKKDPEFRKVELSRQADRLKKAGTNYRFKKGFTPANKGTKMKPEAYEKIKATMFKKGNMPHSTKYDGYERVTVDGYTEVRIAPGKFKLKNRLVYEKHHNITLKKNESVIFIDGNKSNFEITNLQKLTRAELMSRNTIHNYPSELKSVIKLNSQLKKKINEKQN